MMTEEQKLDYADRNTTIFIEEWGTPTNRDEGCGELMSIPRWNICSRRFSMQAEKKSPTVNFLS